MQAAAIVATLLLGVLWIFQIALACGAPWGAAAWGGQHSGVLPARLRIGSGIAAAFVVPLTALYVLASAGVVETDWLPGTGRTAMWVLTGLFAAGAVMNLVSRSRVERIWAPVAMAVAVCCWIVASDL